MTEADTGRMVKANTCFLRVFDKPALWRFQAEAALTVVTHPGSWSSPDEREEVAATAFLDRAIVHRAKLEVREGVNHGEKAAQAMTNRFLTIWNTLGTKDSR